MKLFIGCSSSDECDEDINLDIMNVAVSLAKIDVDYDLIIGGVKGGIMGEIRNIFQKYQKRIMTIVSTKYQEEAEMMPSEITMVCENTFEKTKSIFWHSDVFLILPGGIGTIMEFLSILEEKRTCNSSKPIILFNYNHYYDEFINWLNNLEEQGFINNKDIKQFKVISKSTTLLDYITKELKVEV